MHEYDEGQVIRELQGQEYDADGSGDKRVAYTVTADSVYFRPHRDRGVCAAAAGGG